MEGSLRQKKRKRAEFEPVSSGNVAMKLEVARSKVALEAEVKQKQDALRLLRESINANLHMQADYQDFKRRARWLTGDMKVMQRKYNNQSAVDSTYTQSHETCCGQQILCESFELQARVRACADIPCLLGVY